MELREEENCWIGWLDFQLCSISIELSLFASLKINSNLAHPQTSAEMQSNFLPDLTLALLYEFDLLPQVKTCAKFIESEGLGFRVFEAIIISCCRRCRNIFASKVSGTTTTMKRLLPQTTRKKSSFFAFTNFEPNFQKMFPISQAALTFCCNILCILFALQESKTNSSTMDSSYSGHSKNGPTLKSSISTVSRGSLSISRDSTVLGF